MNTPENIKKVALVFFIILGLLHILTALMIGNSYFPETSSMINNILHIPFALSGTMYAFASVSGGIKKEKYFFSNTFFIIFTIIIFLGLVYLNFFVPNKIS